MQASPFAGYLTVMTTLFIVLSVQRSDKLTSASLVLEGLVWLIDQHFKFCVRHFPKETYTDDVDRSVGIMYNYCRSGSLDNTAYNGHSFASSETAFKAIVLKLRYNVGNHLCVKLLLKVLNHDIMQKHQASAKSVSTFGIILEKIIIVFILIWSFKNARQ